MKAGDRVRIKLTVRYWTGAMGTLTHRAGLIVPGPAWWVKLDNETLNDESGAMLFDDDELEMIE